MPKPDFSEVTQEEVEALFDKDGDLREPGSVENIESADEDNGEDHEEEGEEEPAAEDEEGDEPEEESEEESEDEAEEEEPGELDWSKVAPEHREAFEKAQSENQKLRKDYGKLHSQFTKLKQGSREE